MCEVSLLMLTLRSSQIPDIRRYLGKINLSISKRNVFTSYPYKKIGETGVYIYKISYWHKSADNRIFEPVAIIATTYAKDYATVIQDFTKKQVLYLSLCLWFIYSV